MKRLGRYVQCALLLAASIAVTNLHAQLTEGTIAGSVTDATGATVAGASVKITNVQTGVVQDAVTDSVGFYRVLHLSLGKYRVRVEAKGFKSTVLENITVDVNTITRADAKLQVGGQSETVEVTDQENLVQTEEARLTSTISTEEVTDLPLNGRQVYQLVSLQPGVTQTNAPVISNVPSPTSSVSFDFGYIANGSTPRGNNFVLDGNSNNNEWLGGTPLIYPSLDSVQEVQVETLNFNAEYGRNNGTVVNVVTKSGSNKLHGTAFYTGRNTALNADNYFGKAPLQQHQFGGSLGGAIIKDKTFFFLDYEGSRLKDSAPAQFVSETPEFRQSIITNQPDSIAALFLADFPGPPCVTPIDVDHCLASASQTEPNQADQYLVRVDHHIGNRDQLYARWVNTIASGDVARQELLGAGTRGFKAPFDGFFADLGLGYTHEFSNNIVNDLRIAYSRNNSHIAFAVPSNTQTASILNNQGLPLDAFGQLVFDDGVVPMGGEVFIPRKFVFNTYAVTDTLTHIVGRHALKFGFQLRYIQENSNYQLTSKPFWEFGSIEAFGADAPYLEAALVNRQGCDVTPTVAPCGEFTDTPRHFRWKQWAGFAQDDWKVSPRLTLNLGVRYEVFESPTETNGILSNIILGSGNNLFDQIANASVGRVKKLWNTDKNNFAPRIGISWDPRGKGNQVFRGGFSIAYNEPYSNLYTNASRLDPPDAITTFVDPSAFIGSPGSLVYTFPFVPSPDFAGPNTPNGGIGPEINNVAITPSGVFPNLRTNYSMQWFLGVQQQIRHDMAFTINYVGTSSVGGYTREDYNRFNGDVCNQSFCNFFATRLAPLWGQITYIDNESHATYHGLNAQLKKTYTHGLMFTANYTWGKVLDNVTEGGLGDYFNANGYGGLYSGVQNVENQRGDRGPSEFDATHRFAFTSVWDLPSPKSDGILKTVVGGWQLNSIISLQSGRPFDVYCGLAWFSGCDFNMDDLAYDRPNRPAGIKTSGFSNQQFVNGIYGDPSLTIYGFFSSSRTSQASQVFCPNGLNSILDFGPINSGPGSQCLPVGSNGNLSRNTFRGPAFKNVDLSLFKNFKFGEQFNVQFRAEAFNVFNRVNLYNPTGDLGSAFFGRSTATFPARQIQLGLKILF